MWPWKNFDFFFNRFSLCLLTTKLLYALLILKYRNSDSWKLKRHFRFVFILKNRYFRNCHFKDPVICAKINKKTPTLDCYSRLQRGALFNAKWKKLGYIIMSVVVTWVNLLQISYNWFKFVSRLFNSAVILIQAFTLVYHYLRIPWIWKHKNY